MPTANERETSVERRGHVKKIEYRREIARACTRCGCERRQLNGAYFRMRRQLAKVTLREMAAVFGADGRGVSLQLLSRMERGDIPFAPKYAEAYDQLFERRGE